MDILVVLLIIIWVIVKSKKKKEGAKAKYQNYNQRKYNDLDMFYDNN